VWSTAASAASAKGHQRGVGVINKTLRLVLGDQLSINHSWFTKPTPKVDYVLIEAHSEASYAPHHIQKVIAFFTAMREFARELQDRGFSVRYITLDDPTNRKPLAGNIEHLVSSLGYTRFEYQDPDEYRVARELEALAKKLPCDTAKSPQSTFSRRLSSFSRCSRATSAM